MNWRPVQPNELAKGDIIKNYGEVYHVAFRKDKYVVYSLGRRPTYYTIEDTVMVSE